MKTTITVVWSAFAKDKDLIKESGKVTDATLKFETEIPPAMFDTEILELLYEQTNLYAGDVWERYFKDKMPENRSHTALSIGDKVTIARNDDTSIYICVDVGWELVFFGNSIKQQHERDVFQLDQDRMMSRMADAEMGDL